MQRNICSRGMPNRTNTSATLWSLQSVKPHGGGPLHVRTTPDNFEVVLVTGECVGIH